MNELQSSSDFINMIEKIQNNPQAKDFFKKIFEPESSYKIDKDSQELK